jgi:MFS family permease
MPSRAGAAGFAWVLAAIYYFYQYALRSAPAVMMPQLADAFNLTTVAMASMVGVFYYGYSAFSLVAGTAVDRLGARAVLPAGALLTGCGSFLFATGDVSAANVGRVLQGCGGAFALVGAIYIASNNFPSSRAATLTGGAQMFGMAGGSAGQVLVGPLMASGVSWVTFWIGMGFVGVLIAAALLVLLPGKPEPTHADAKQASISGLFTVFRNPQTVLCGVIAGLMFIPTTIFDMIWGVRYLQEAHGFDYGDAVMRSATVPLGWIIGCPLLGMISDRLGRRKPVIIGGAVVLLACLTWILYGPTEVFPPYSMGLIAGVASGAAMLTYTVCKEANAPHLSGTAAGAVSFLNLTFSALVGPILGGIMKNLGGAQSPLESYQNTFQPLLYGVAVAIVLTLMLKETGRAVRIPLVTAAEAA